TSWPGQSGFRPLLMLTFAFNYMNGGLNPLNFRIINIFIHFLNAILIYFILKNLIREFYGNKSSVSGDSKNVNFKNSENNKKEALLFFLTGIFTVHPVYTGTVIYISSRSDLMATFFILCGFLLYLANKSLPVLLLYIAALLTKETGLCFGLLILTGDFIRTVNRRRKFRHCIKGKWLVYFGIFFISAGYFIYRNAINIPLPQGSTRSLLSNVLIQSAVTFLYLKLFLFPFALNIIHYIPDLNSLSQPLSLASVAGIATILGLIFIFIKKSPLISIGLSWLIIGLLPKFYMRLTVVAMEYHFYFASIGIYMVLIALLKISRMEQRKYFSWINGGVILLFAILTILRGYEYRDPLLFWQVAKARNPHDITIRFNLAETYYQKGLYEQAINEIGFIVAVEKEAFDVYLLSGNVYYGKGDIDSAFVSYSKAVRLNPESSEAYSNLGVIYKRWGQRSQAYEAFKEALRLNPYLWVAYSGLADCYMEERLFREAADYYKQALKLNPDEEVLYIKTGKAFFSLGDYKEALDYFYKVFDMNFSSVEALEYIGMIYGNMGKFDEAIEVFRGALKIDPTNERMEKNILKAKSLKELIGNGK
ncbi:MAG: tetratricopeptide repeat protein, partial [Candidatus Omnitrophota bacterium]